MSGWEAGISVVVTCHNYGHYLHRCLGSIEAQTLAPERVVVVDDASEDATSKVAATFSESLPDMVFARVDFRNANRTRNHGFDLTASEQVVFFDADNEMGPLFLERLSHSLSTDPSAAFAYCDRINVLEGDAESLPEPPGHWQSQPFDASALKRANYIDMASLVRRGSFPGFDEALPMYQDWDLWLSIVGLGGKGIYVPEPLFRYRVHDNSLGHRTDPDPAAWRIRRKHRLGVFGAMPLVRDSLTAFRALRKLRKFVGGDAAGSR
jgi:glycosyltransferase involved in cell wall biosynthesis